MNTYINSNDFDLSMGRFIIEYFIHCSDRLILEEIIVN